MMPIDISLRLQKSDTIASTTECDLGKTLHGLGAHMSSTPLRPNASGNHKMHYCHNS